MEPITLDFISSLYSKYSKDLAAVRDAQRSFLQERGKSMKPQLDDLEAEITYLLVREARPANVVEIGTFYGWSTTWLLSALRDNGVGQLHSFDIVSTVTQNVPAELSEGRWTFNQGDMRESLGKVPETDYLFIDADHGAKFARWYIDHLFPLMRSGTPTSVHDVFHGKRTLPFTEGAVVTKWLADKKVEFFTPSAAKDPESNRALTKLKGELGLTEPVRPTPDNPMIYFLMP
ncbi:class I SAM-dependent methyltransferase [Actinoplanes sp. NPDC051346]|uniref:class I SAM-dependent methyltransferase n=1 Tax=Actinoplanes sp. NPDC051346 TaxID=3155048 RepID=UPI003437B097